MNERRGESAKRERKSEERMRERERMIFGKKKKREKKLHFRAVIYDWQECG